jgi:hypothetical protein
MILYLTIGRLGSSVGIATGYGLDGPGIESPQEHGVQGGSNHLAMDTRSDRYNPVDGSWIYSEAMAPANGFFFVAHQTPSRGAVDPGTNVNLLHTDCPYPNHERLYLFSAKGQMEDGRPVFSTPPCRQLLEHCWYITRTWGWGSTRSTSRLQGAGDTIASASPQENPPTHRTATTIVRAMPLIPIYCTDYALFRRGVVATETWPHHIICLRCMNVYDF